MPYICPPCLFTETFCFAVIWVLGYLPLERIIEIREYGLILVSGPALNGFGKCALRNTIYPVTLRCKRIGRGNRQIRFIKRVECI